MGEGVMNGITVAYKQFLLQGIFQERIVRFLEILSLTS